MHTLCIKNFIHISLPLSYMDVLILRLCFCGRHNHTFNTPLLHNQIQTVCQREFFFIELIRTGKSHATFSLRMKFVVFIL